LPEIGLPRGIQMGLWRATKKTLGHAVDLRFDRWLDLASLGATTRYIWQQVKYLFVSKPLVEHPETFEEAIDRLELSPEALSQQSQAFKFLALFFLSAALALLCYAFFVLYLGNWMGAIISFSLAIYAGSLAFRFHFWYFQITEKKLGCNIREWIKRTSE
jgi:intracellular multiplication protein IcmV